MALTNFSLPFGALASPWGATISPIHPIHQLASNTNNLLYSPADHQQEDDGTPPPAGSDYYKNNPYSPPQLHQQQPQQQQTYHYSINSNSNNNNNNSNNRRKSGNTYLPPIPPPGARNTQYHIQQQQQIHYSQFHTQQQQQHQQQQQQHEINNNNNNNIVYKQTAAAAATATAAAAATATQTTTSTRTYGEGSYSRFPVNTQAQQQQQQQQQLQHQQQQQQQQQQKYYNSYNTQQQTRSSLSSSSSATFKSQQQQQPQQQQSAQVGQQQQPQQQQQQNFGTNAVTPSPTYGAAISPTINSESSNNNNNNAAEQNKNNAYPQLPPGFTRVQAGQGSRTQVHAVLDYDIEEGDDDYYDPDDQGEAVNKDGKNTSAMPTVTPIQGPIYLKNGTVPVVPLFSYPTINNGTFVQIPIWWTALSVALGLDVRGDIIKGVPCIKRFHQLFCPTAGNSYPIDKIERFIDDNKALMRRMYGDFEMNMDSGGPRQQTKKRRRRFIDEPDIFIPPVAYPSVIPNDETAAHAEEAGESYFGKLRNKRQANQNRNGNKNGAINAPNGPTNTGSTTGRLDACESKTEIVTPYWASNSAGKIRAIVNTQHFEQAIHQEICSKTQTPRCEGECGCEQKYKWHRLLAYDPDNDCKGIFMDWFLFPSCCVCRCNP